MLFNFGNPRIHSYLFSVLYHVLVNTNALVSTIEIFVNNYVEFWEDSTDEKHYVQCIRNMILIYRISDSGAKQNPKPILRQKPRLTFF
jgi:hypothetical protein